MKKMAVILLILLIFCGIETVGFTAMESGKAAAKNTAAEVVKCTITSIDKATDVVVVKDIKTCMEKIITATANNIASLKIGEEVKVILKAGTNVAEKIIKIVEKPIAKKK